MEILFEDNHLLVINKPAGLLVQGDKTGDIPLVELAKEYIKKKYNKPGKVFLGVVHRLDRPTSGVLVFARTSKALTRLNEQFQQRIPKKTYWVVVNGLFKEKTGSLIHWLVRNPKQNKSYAYQKEVGNSKKAILHFNLLKELNRYTALEINLETGRHHQIRSQLSTVGFPIKGDLKYGASRNNSNGSIHLHSRTLSIEHPISRKKMEWVASPPKDVLWDVILSD